MSSDNAISRQLRKSITQFPDDAPPAQRLLFKISALSTIASLGDVKLKNFLLPMVRSL